MTASAPTIDVRELTSAEVREHVSALAQVLLDCVEGGASVSFMASFSRSDAEAFFVEVARQVENGGRILLAAFLDGSLVGTVQIILATPPNQAHRADVAKLLVSRAARGQGAARQLMKCAEEASLKAGKTLLVLDTVTGDVAEMLYFKLGWVKVGVIPNYALYPDGTPCDTTIFYKQLFI